MGAISVGDTKSGQTVASHFVAFGGGVLPFLRLEIAQRVSEQSPEYTHESFDYFSSVSLLACCFLSMNEQQFEFLEIRPSCLLET